MGAFVELVSYRRFVYNNYTWNRDGSDYTDYNGHLIPSRIPIAALLQGKTSLCVIVLAHVAGPYDVMVFQVLLREDGGHQAIPHHERL